jgi:hypothetical protein
MSSAHTREQYLPLLIPKQEKVVGYFEPLLEHGEQIEIAGGPR